MDKKYKETLDNLDNFMIVLKRYKDIPDNSDLMLAMNKLVKSRNEFKTEYMKNFLKEKMKQTALEQPNKYVQFAKFLDTVSHLT